MELKHYQQEVINDLNNFLIKLNQFNNPAKAYEEFWKDKNVSIGFGAIKHYKELIKGTPNICFKIPTGGGKTFVACNSIKPVFDNIPERKAKVVVWLVPSDTILEQTIKNLTNPSHPYRQRIDIDFGGRVEILTKSQALSGQSFSPTSINEQLTILVLSYDSFRTSNKEGRKVYQENGNLAQFSKIYDNTENLIKDADDTALAQIINKLSPLVIVDESHHATTSLSKDMLNDLNPSFIIELTATPKKDSNILSFVDATKLKSENMVKLPVIVYNQKTQSDVIYKAIDLRNNLEKVALEEETITGRYIRPIVLFQAQPKNNDANTTFEKIKQKLIELDIPAEQIAIKTSEKNELKNIDLLSQNCQIRYIITVNALKEGWDCPFAYILATLANKTSEIDVEQILGRILRQPYTQQNNNNFLNISYVLTSSQEFQNTLRKIVVGLNSAGFSENDYRVGKDETTIPPIISSTFQLKEQQVIYEIYDTTGDNDDIEINIQDIKEKLNNTTSITNEILKYAENQVTEYNSTIEKIDDSEIFSIPLEVRENMNNYKIRNQFNDEIKNLKMPQFFIETHPTIFSQDDKTLLTREALTEGFLLKNKDCDINFNSIDEQIFSVDVDGSTPKYKKLDNTNSKLFKDYFSKLPISSKINSCKKSLYNQLNKINSLDSKDLMEYIDRIISTFTEEQLDDLTDNIQLYANKIKSKINSLQVTYCEKRFYDLLQTSKIVCLPNYKFKEFISPTETTELANSLYEKEEAINDFEFKAISTISSLPNIKWWHRNIDRKDFCINGFINHYPDFIVMTNKGKIVAIETKGDHLLNDDSKTKINLGNAWQNFTDDTFRYYMVFENKEVEGAYSLDKFIEIIKEL